MQTISTNNGSECLPNGSRYGTDDLHDYALYLTSYRSLNGEGVKKPKSKKEKTKDDAELGDEKRPEKDKKKKKKKKKSKKSKKDEQNQSDLDSVSASSSILEGLKKKKKSRKKSSKKSKENKILQDTQHTVSLHDEIHNSTLFEDVDDEKVVQRSREKMGGSKQGIIISRNDDQVSESVSSLEDFHSSSDLDSEIETEDEEERNSKPIRLAFRNLKFLRSVEPKRMLGGNMSAMKPSSMRSIDTRTSRRNHRKIHFVPQVC